MASIIGAYMPHSVQILGSATHFSTIYPIKYVHMVLLRFGCGYGVISDWTHMILCIPLSDAIQADIVCRYSDVK